MVFYSKLQGDHIRFSSFDWNCLYLQVGSPSSTTTMSCVLPTTLKFKITKTTAALSPLLQPWPRRTVRMATSAHGCMIHQDQELCLQVPQAMRKSHGDQVTLWRGAFYKGM